MIHPLGSGLILLCAVELLLCVVFYGGWFRWWTSSEGWHLFAFMGVFAVALGLWAGLLLSSGTAWTPMPAGPREWMRVLLPAAIAVVVADRLRLLVKGKREEIRRRKGNGHGD